MEKRKEEKSQEGTREGRVGRLMDGQTDRWVDEGEGAVFPSGHQLQTSGFNTSAVRGFWSPAAKF